MPAPRRVLVFDGDCAFCSSIARWAQRRLPKGAGTVPWQYVDDPSEYGLTTEEIREAAYWIDERGRAYRGHEAAAATLREIGGGWSVVAGAMELPGVRDLASIAYELISRNRHRLPGGTPTCRLER